MDTLRALGPLHGVCQVCNLWQWHLDKDNGLLHRSRWLELYGWTVLVAAGGYTAYGLFQESNGGEEEPADMGAAETTISSIGHTVDFIQLVGIRVAHMAALLEALWQRQAQCNFYAELAEIDRQLAGDLQMSVDSRQVRRSTMRRAMWMLGGYLASQTLILVAKLLAPGSRRFPIYWIQYLLPMLVCGLRYFQIFTAVRIVAQRLQLLLDALQTLQLQDSEAETPAASMKRLVAVRQLYQRVWSLVTLLNRSHGLSILILVGNDFLAITSNCYWIFLNFRQSAATPYDILQIVASAVWSAPHLGNVLVVSLICDRAAQCATRLALSLHQVSVDLTNDLHNALITQFSLQLLHQKLYFSAAGFFNVDNTLLYTIVGATTTYLIILIQFHMSESTMSNGSSGG